MNSLAEVFEKVSEVFDSLNSEYIKNLPSSRSGVIYNNSEIIVKSNVMSKYDLLYMATLENSEFDTNKSKQLIEMAETLVFCMSFHRENKELARRYYAEKIENYPTHLRWLMMQFYINDSVDFLNYFKHSYKIKFTEHRVMSIAKTKDDVNHSIENNGSSDIVIELIDDTIKFCDDHRHLPRKEYALLAKKDDESKVGIRMSVYDNKEPNYVRYINKNYYVFDRIIPIMELVLNKK